MLPVDFRGEKPEQRVETHVLARDETRISTRGHKAPLFTKNAMALIHQPSGGMLRTIATIAGGGAVESMPGH